MTTPLKEAIRLWEKVWNSEVAIMNHEGCPLCVEYKYLSYCGECPLNMSGDKCEAKNSKWMDLNDCLSDAECDQLLSEIEYYNPERHAIIAPLVLAILNKLKELDK
jgi:hypothetical protein